MNYNNLVLFDGMCNLCSGAVQFIIKHERSNELRFASLQSGTGRRLLGEYNIDSSVTDSLVFISGGTAFVKSRAALKIASHLKFPYTIASGFGFVPQFLGDLMYDFIARHRYRFFGKKKTCWIPRPEWKDRFVDEA